MNHSFYAILEGTTDQTFFNHIIRPELRKKYNKVGTFVFKQRTKQALKNFITTCKNTDKDYVFFSDMDNVSCYTKKKNNIKSKIAPNVDREKIIIVKAEIESWYVAGVNQSDAKNLNIIFHTNTEGITKEIFRAMMRPPFESHIDFMREILKYYSIDTAKKQNPSFKYFCDKFITSKSPM